MGKLIFSFLLIGTLSFGPNTFRHGLVAPFPTKTASLLLPLSGDYSIGGDNPDFQDIAEAVSALTTEGVSGPVTFHLRDGQYEEQIRIANINGASADNPIVFRSESGENSQVVWSFPATTAEENYVLQLDSAQFVTIQDISMKATGTDFGIVVDITSEAHNISLINNTLEGLDTFSADVIFAIVHLQGTGLQLENNHLQNGSIGIYGKPLPSSNQNSSSIQQNVFESQAAISVFLEQREAVEVLSNEFLGGASAIVLSSCRSGMKILKNKINIQNNPGILLDQVQGGGDDQVVVANNFVHVGGDQEVYGIISTESYNADIVFNTIHISSTHPGASGIFLQETGSKIRNNIFVNTGGGFALIDQGEGGGEAATDSDYNSLFTTGPSLVSILFTSYPDLASYHASFNAFSEKHSILVNPNFTSATDLHINNSALNGTGIPQEGITDDLDGEARDPLSPDIGADEIAPARDLAATAFLTPKAPFPPGHHEVSVRVRNLGDEIISTAAIHWTINGVAQAVFNWTGSLAKWETDSIVIGSYNFQAAVGHEIMAWTSAPNGFADPNLANDTIATVVYTTLTGVYTIGGNAPDFPDFSAAAVALNKGGVSGPVRFDVRPGTYEEQLRFTKVAGASAANAITFQSESGDSTTVVLAYNSTAFNNNYLLQLDSAEFFTFKNLSFTALSEQFGIIIAIDAEANHNTFIGNVFHGSEQGGTFTDIVRGSGFPLSDGISFLGNRFVNGRAGIVFRGINAALSVKDLVIANNEFENQKSFGIQLFRIDAPRILNNVFSSSHPADAISCQSCLNELQILSNKISTAGRGISMLFHEGAADQVSLVANNFVHVSGNSQEFGIISQNSTFINLFHNSINVTNSHTLSRGLYLLNGADIQIVNNIVVNTGGGYVIYTNSTENISRSDYNAFFEDGNRFGFWAVETADFNAWQTASSMDQHSLFLDPLFVSSEDLHTAAPALDGSGLPLGVVPADIDGEPRDAEHPDIGADEFSSAGDIGVSVLLDLASPVCDLSVAEPLKVIIENYSGQPQTGFTMAYIINDNVSIVENVGPLVIPPLDTAGFVFSTKADLSAADTYDIQIYTLLDNDADPSNDTLNASIRNLLSPDSIRNMLPVDGAENLSQAFTFSWSPSANATAYDLYIWRDTSSRPDIPFAADLQQISFTPSVPLVLGASYKWQLVAKNDICTVAGPIQSFTIFSLPDLRVTNVQVPATPSSGQTIEVSWQVNNNGGGSTGSLAWVDAVYLSTESVFDPSPGATTYLGGVPNLTALNEGDFYTQTENFTLPEGIDGSFFLFVVTDRFSAVEESNEGNNATSQAMPILLTPPPDLQITSIISPTTTFSGQRIDNLSWTVTNLGTGPTKVTKWRDKIYLSDSMVFDLSTAVFLNAYTHQNDIVLNPNESYTGTKRITLPRAIEGPYFIHIVTDADNSVFEHVFEGNNIGTSDTLTVIVAPPADLLVEAVSTADTASNGESVEVVWTVKNEGAIATSSFWRDGVYISNTVPFNPDSSTLLFIRTSGTLLDPGASYEAQQRLIIPNELSGTFYIYVQADLQNNVFEYLNEANNTKRSDAIEIINADLVVPMITAPDAAASGTDLSIQWQVQNNGPGAVIQRKVTDQICISSHPIFHPDSVLVLADHSYQLSLSREARVTKQLSVQVPNGLSGTYYLFVKTDDQDKVFEAAREDNNSSNRSIEVSLPPWPDLHITNMGLLPDNAIANEILPINFTVLNQGNQAAQGAAWSDRIYISASPVWNPTEVVELQTLEVLQPLETDKSYTQTTSFLLPMLGNNAASGVCFIYVFTDADNTIYEHTDEGNNILRSAPINVSAPPPVDLVLIDAGPLPDTVQSGATYTIQWQVQNQGSSTALWDYGLWYDGIFLSTDTIWDEEDVFIEDWTQTGPVENGASYADLQDFKVPNGASGDFYFLMVADDQDDTRDGNRINNVRTVPVQGGASKVHIVLSPSPDLLVSAFSAPAQGIAGQPLQIIYRVINNGTSPTSGSWTDKVYLSTDLKLDPSDEIIGTFSKDIALAQSEAYTDTVQVFLPVSAAGNQILILKTEANDVIFELDGEDNNTASSAILITQPPPADLVVSAIQAPDMAIVGETVPIQWTIKNEGDFPANGLMRDIIYLSADSIFDASDVRLKNCEASINLPPLAELTRSAEAVVPGLALGNYHLIVQTDALNNILERSDTNNVTISTEKLQISLPELPIGVLTSNELSNEATIYYRIEVPDSLAGETLLISLRGDSLNGVNELFLAHNFVPTKANHEFSHAVPFGGNQEILVPTLLPGTYYLLISGRSIASAEQTIEVLAEIIEFQLRSVNANQGGNTGSVTVKIEGAKFEEDMFVSLAQGNQSDILAQQVYFLNTTSLFATFDLAGAAEGFYDLIVEKTNAESASLINGFEVVAGSVGSDAGGGSPGSGGFFCTIENIGTSELLLSNINHPPNTRRNRIVGITIQFGNAGNIDVPTPNRFLISLAGAPLSYDTANLDENLQELYLEFQEQNGPPGLLRPGAIGSLTVYTQAVRRLRFLLKE